MNSGAITYNSTSSKIGYKAHSQQTLDEQFSTMSISRLQQTVGDGLTISLHFTSTAYSNKCKH